MQYLIVTLINIGKVAGDMIGREKNGKVVIVKKCNRQIGQTIKVRITNNGNKYCFAEEVCSNV